MKANNIKELDDRSHLLLRGEYILGSFSYVERDMPILGENGLEHRNVRFCPALLKMVNEIIDNSVDEGVRTNWKHSSHIRVALDDSTLTVDDDGRGIPIKPVEGASADDNDRLMPVVAFTQARAGANFDDNGRTTIGMNGVGAFAANVFSRRFEVTTDDGKKKLKLACRDNCSEKKITFAMSKDTGTRVFLEPDFSRFEAKSFDDTFMELIRQRLMFLAATYRDASFYLNGKAIKFWNATNFLSQFGSTYEMIESKNSERPWFIAVLPSPAAEFVHFSYVNGIYLPRGGNHIDNLAWEIGSRLRDKAARKHPNIKPADIKNRLSIIAFFSNFPDAKFDSQTKEALANAVPDVKAYLEIDGDQFDKLANRVWRNEGIMNPILEMHRLQEELKNQKELEKRKPPKRVVNDKYQPPVGGCERLFLCEGDSAVSGLSAALGRQGNGYFALRGVPLNAYEVTQQKMLGNKELSAIIDILRLDLSGKDKTIAYDSIVIASDADFDGWHIRGLLIAFFMRFAPWVLEQGKLKMLDTPVIVAVDKKGPTRWWYNLPDHTAAIASAPLLKDEQLRYKKGLGSWKPPEFKAFVEKAGFDSILIGFEVDSKAASIVKTWMSRKAEDGVRASDGRKFYVGDRSFDIFSM